MIQGSIHLLSQILQTDLHQISPETPFTAISTDTRQLEPGSVFIALKGENFDGHAFLDRAWERGAIAAITDRPVAGPHLRVPDTLLAYQQIAHWWRHHFSIPVIAITGSAGKTTTKELLAGALHRYGPVLKSPANHNNDIGVAQTLLQLRSDHRFAVLELAMRGPGEIGRLARTAAPTHGLILNIGYAHIGRLGSRTAIAQAKCELLAVCPHIQPILNGEDDLLLETARSLITQTPITFGLDRGDVRGRWDAQAQAIQLQNHEPDRLWPVPLPGRHQALNWMAVLATIQTLGLPLEPLQSPLCLDDELAGRHRRLQLANDLQIIDETYNAAPEAMIAALHLLSQIPGQRRWAILGPMRELGEQAAELYARIGQVSAGLPIDQLWVLDPDQEMAPLLLPFSADQVRSFDSGSDLMQALIQQVRPGDRLLFKAARAMQLELLMQGFIDRWQQTKVIDPS